jgi:PAT family beta-lactamase induction signal transducer AmpG
LLLPKFVGGFSGGWVDMMGYSQFFIFTAILGIPALILIIVVSRSPFANIATVQTGRSEQQP